MSENNTNNRVSNDPLHGVTLEKLLTLLVERYGWQYLAEQVDINCFKNDPSIKSSLKFLRRTPWARQKVEEVYIRDIVNGPWGKGTVNKS